MGVTWAALDLVQLDTSAGGTGGGDDGGDNGNDGIDEGGCSGVFWNPTVLDQVRSDTRTGSGNDGGTRDGDGDDDSGRDGSGGEGRVKCRGDGDDSDG